MFCRKVSDIGYARNNPFWEDDFMMGYLLGTLIFVAIAFGMFIEKNVAGCVPAALAVYCGIRCLKKRRENSSDGEIESLELPNISGENAELVEECYNKAVTDYNYLNDAMDKLQDEELKEQLAKIQDIAYRMLQYVKKNPEKILLARRFVDYYQDRAVVMVNQYIEMEKLKLESDEVVSMKHRVKDMLNSFDEAYEEQFSKLLNDQLMNMDAELKVMQQNLDADGIKVEETPEKPTTESAMDRAARENWGRVEKIQTGSGLYNMGGRGRGMHRRQAQTVCMGPAYVELSPIEKSKVVEKKMKAGVLALLLGSFGAHKFYLGKWKRGFLYLIFFWSMIPGMISFVEGLRYLFMRNENFYDQYMKS